MNLKPVKLIPCLVAFIVILLASLASCLRLDFFERLERMTFDMRAREALRFSPPVATNLGFVFIDEESIRRVRNGSLGYRFSLYWPRQVYGRVVEELADQGAKTVAFDVILGELRPLDPPVQMADGSLPDSDEFFALQMKLAGNVVIPVTQEVTPPSLFITNACVVGDISTDKDDDGILRRAKAFRLHHDGTLDKFIGDCVMAFWGAPTPNQQHALFCVRAAIEAQCAIYKLNCQRKAENQKRASENASRVAAGLPPHPILPILFVGTGINTGVATVGLMGSATKAVVRQGSYSVFGREVNLASRLEGLSGRGHIYISESTYAHLRRDDPALAQTCTSLPPVNVKGIRTALHVYEVPWRAQGGQPLEEEFASPTIPEITTMAGSS